jgi:hypothetical protein
MATFWRLLEESVITQALVTIALVGAVIYLVVSGQPIPEALFGLASMAMGFYFGSKGALSGTQAAKAVIQKLTEEG